MYIYFFSSVGGVRVRLILLNTVVIVFSTKFVHLVLFPLKFLYLLFILTKLISYRPPSRPVWIASPSPPPPFYSNSSNSIRYLPLSSLPCYPPSIFSLMLSTYPQLPSTQPSPVFSLTGLFPFCRFLPYSSLFLLPSLSWSV